MKEKMVKPGIVKVSGKEQELLKRDAELQKQMIDLKIKQLELEKEWIEFEYGDLDSGEIGIPKCRSKCAGKENNH